MMFIFNMSTPSGILKFQSRIRHSLSNMYIPETSKYFEVAGANIWFFSFPALLHTYYNLRHDAMTRRGGNLQIHAVMVRSGIARVHGGLITTMVQQLNLHINIQVTLIYSTVRPQFRLVKSIFHGLNYMPRCTPFVHKFPHGNIFWQIIVWVLYC